MTKLMLNCYEMDGPTDEFEFTGRWRCGPINDYIETDVKFEVRFTMNFLERRRYGLPKTKWFDSSRFVNVNLCDIIKS